MLVILIVIIITLFVVKIQLLMLRMTKNVLSAVMGNLLPLVLLALKLVGLPVMECVMVLLLVQEIKLLAQ